MLINGKGKVNDELRMVMLCCEMNWDYFTYLKQPDWFLDSIMIKKNLEIREQKRQENKQKRYGK